MSDGDQALQPVLFHTDDEAAILFTAEEKRKRYTAGQAAKLEQLYDAVCLCLAAGWPVSSIARELNMQMRTVQAVAAREAEKVSQKAEDLSEMLMRTATRWIGRARAKEEEASFKDLTIGAGIIMQHARDLAAMGQLGHEKETKEDQDHVQAAEALRRLMDQAGQADDLVATSSDSVSPVEPLTDNALQVVPVFGAGIGAGEDLPVAPVQAGLATLDAAAPRGGSDAGPEVQNPMDPSAGGLSAKATPHEKTEK